ncbi:hypothetical protein GCM10010129_76490 [Streptomyces fumigatiscleroticus]|nr:hypothetical protein GCM10010129_76490 [Streptomyces fumigatiscleroticus]
MGGEGRAVSGRVRGGPVALSGAHRVLVGVVVAGAVVVAGIGFAGSYAAVRELAVRKGFGTLAWVFPVGVDAGICVLLALDVLLTWSRIPFGLLRQTAWLLTAATIAFNGAAAWPDPLGVGMHAVIPVLFIVAVEAARHAVGHMADLAAGKHLEGARLARWLLSPARTFLLWRRMRLWELRSYEQAVDGERERLVYRARLRARFGRAWRRRAPVESLLPLRLARWGVPLAQTAPAGLAAAGLSPPAAPVPAADGAALRPGSPATVAPAANGPTAQRAGAGPIPKRAGRAGWERCDPPGAAEEAGSVQRGTGGTLSPGVAVPSTGTAADGSLPGRGERSEPAFAPEARAAPDQRAQQVTAFAAAAPAGREKGPGQRTGLTTVDHYYLVWRGYQAEHGAEPTAEQLSAHLARRGQYGRGGDPVSPANLRRYVLPWRVYTVWAEHRRRTETPGWEAVAGQCAARGITAQYNRPVTVDYLAREAGDFERRWRALTAAHADAGR